MPRGRSKSIRRTPVERLLAQERRDQGAQRRHADDTTRARYQDVVRRAQENIAEEAAADLVRGRISPGPGASRHKEAANLIAGAPVGLLLFGDPNLGRGFRDTRAMARRALGVLTDPAASLRDRVGAAGVNVAVAGAVGPFGVPKRPAVDAAGGHIPAARPVPGKAGSERVSEAIPAARSAREQQERLYSAERGKRAARGAQRLEALTGEEAFAAARAELKGELPKLRYGGIRDTLSQDTVDSLVNQIKDHPDLRFFEKVRTKEALDRILGSGLPPTRSQIRLLEQVFEPETTADLVGAVPMMRKLVDAGLQIVNVPRSIVASFDLSAPFRQGLVLGSRHPRMFAREFRPMLRAFKSERAYEDTMEAIARSPDFDRMQKGRLALTDLENLSTREDAFMSNLAERIPGIGVGVRMSSRAYVAFLNKFRADAFSNYLRLAEQHGLDTNDEHLLRSIARWVNHATGRGSIKMVEGAMVPATAVFFSPRLIASRLQLLNPVFYASLHPFARKQAIQGMAQTLGAISLTLWLAKMAGAEVGVDPRSSDFAKVKFGDTRIDLAGGFQQYLVAAARMVKGEKVSTTTGEVQRLEGGFGKPSRADLLWDFASNKFAPVPAYLKQWAENENRNFEPFDPVRDALPSVAPLGIQNTVEGFREGGTAAGITSATLGSIGFGVQTYKPKPRKPKKRSSSSLRAGRQGSSKSLRRK